ncbi:MAG TPA: type II secretion system protein [Verrucomicrobiae bacterium]|jgi:prepilin-type N-terminal cleavage/methylation domain-containing protein
MKMRLNIKGSERQGSTECRAAIGFGVASGFTMIEIAISLAVIGIALVAIIGVLPIGMRTQQDNRQETIINQDATILLEDIRNGVRSADDLTNYVYAITNYWTFYNGNTTNSGVNGYTFSNTYASPSIPPFPTLQPLTNGINIIGLLSMPEYEDNNGYPILNWTNSGFSNHVVAYISSISGPAVEKPPQPTDSLVRQSAFGYRLICETVAVPLSTPDASVSSALQNNLYELRLFFRWPQQPSGSLGPGAQSFRTMIAGRLLKDRLQPNLFFFQSQSFTNAVVAAQQGPLP